MEGFAYEEVSEETDVIILYAVTSNYVEPFGDDLKNPEPHDRPQS